MKKILACALTLLVASQLMALPRAEYPRPQFERKEWANLNGEWTYAFDFVGSGMEKKFHESQGFEGHITVPFCPESKLSGVGYTDFIRHIWYQRTISVPQSWVGKDILLHFGAVYHTSEIFIDGKLAGRHFGGSTSFALDITRLAGDGKEHSLVVHAYSDPRTGLQPAGKQNARLVQFECMYTRCTGIWQTVWMEPVAHEALSRVQVITDIDQKQVVVQPYFANPGAAQLVVTLRDGKKIVAQQKVAAQNGAIAVLPVKKPRLWSPADPYLDDLTYEVQDAQGQPLDEVKSYCGMRKIHVQGNKVYLNNEPFYQRLVLDQGFYPDGIWTAPSDDALRHDVELSQQAGFNGARLHQKVFEERFHYWADKLGYLTWGEAPSWGMDANDPEVARNFMTEWSEEILRDRNHPSIVTWTPMNEEWWPDRVQYPRFVSDVYDLTKALDPTRPVCDVSGGVHVKTDIWTTHSYEQDPAKLKELVYNGERWFNREPKPINVPTRNMGFNRLTDTNLYDYQNYDAPTMPYILDEFGGIKWVKGQDKETGNSQQSWGYGEPPHSLEEFYARLEGQVDALLSLSENVWGYCYTQLTDVEQEQNGIYFYDRSTKFDMKRIHAIFSKTPR